MEKTLDRLIEEFGTDNLLEMMFAYICARKDIMQKAKKMVRVGEIKSVEEVIIPRFDMK